MSTKREITFCFVIDSRGARVFAAIDAISRITDQLTITSKSMSRRPERPVVKQRRGPSASPKLDKGSESLSNEPQLVYSANPETPHNRVIDVEASLKRLGLTREQLVSRTWPRGSSQHRLKRAAAHTAGVGAGPANRASRNNGVSMGTTRQ